MSVHNKRVQSSVSTKACTSASLVPIDFRFNFHDFQWTRIIGFGAPLQMARPRKKMSMPPVELHLGRFKCAWSPRPTTTKSNQLLTPGSLKKLSTVADFRSSRIISWISCATLIFGSVVRSVSKRLQRAQAKGWVWTATHWTAPKDTLHSVTSLAVISRWPWETLGIDLNILQGLDVVLLIHQQGLSIDRIRVHRKISASMSILVGFDRTPFVESTYFPSDFIPFFICSISRSVEIINMTSHEPYWFPLSLLRLRVLFIFNPQSKTCITLDLDST